MEKQQTLAGSSIHSGIALHTGVRATLKLLPAPENTGIVFRRVDLEGRPEVRGLASNVVDVQRGTTIASGRAVVYTIEHIMSALHAFNVDNCIVEMDGQEPPICDGSSKVFVQMIKEAGIKVQDAEAEIFTPEVPVMVEKGGTKVMIFPDNEKLSISCVTNFDGCPYDPQFFECEISEDTYVKEISVGRTFVDYRDLKTLFSYGLCKGGSLDAACIISNGAIICKDQLRYTNEIVRHKILDLVGDIYLTGCRIRGKIFAIRPGHPRNVDLATKLLAMRTQQK